ncbi:MAG: hypothetical protein H5U40_15885 [Polyangiaceae bacterium]|nr:hypothetical protein [Polyangiaceae bacterium]
MHGRERTTARDGLFTVDALDQPASGKGAGFLDGSLDAYRLEMVARERSVVAAADPLRLAWRAGHDGRYGGRRAADREE